MTVNELPTFLPWVNLAVSVAAVALVAWMTVASYRHATSGRVRLLHVGKLLAVIVLVAGAAFQANLIPLEAWGAIGTGGRILVLIVLMALVGTPDATTRAERHR